jgi:ABC-type multidrug transport system permease subunit
MDATVLIFLVLFSCLIGSWARAWNRDFWVWGILALIFSPLIMSIVLLIAGRAKPEDSA